MDKALCQRIEQLLEKAERVGRFLDAFNRFTRITETEIAARHVTEAGRHRLLPKKTVPIKRTMLGPPWAQMTTVDYKTVTVGNQQDAQDALKAKLHEIDEPDDLRGTISFCREALARDTAVSLTTIEVWEERCDRVEEEIKRESDRQRKLVNDCCYPIPHIKRNTNRRY